MDVCHVKTVDGRSVDNKFIDELLLLDEYIRRVSAYFCYNKEEGEDLIQDVYIKAIEKQHQYQQGTNLKSWIFSIIRNTYINLYRKNKIKKERNITTLEFHRQVNTDHLLINKEIEKELRALPKALKSSFILRTMGYSYIEISEILNRNIGTIKSQIFHAREILQEKLECYHYDS
jgi:RNA polymerase sigma-70 factor, ECF subfamily